MKNQNNGNSQVNSSRESINSNIDNYSLLGGTMRVKLSKKRRFRTI